MARFGQLVLFKQSIFGIPWLIVGAIFPFLEQRAVMLDSARLFYLFGAFFSARFSGMCFNRLIDASIDAKNPRTVDRLLPRGDVSSKEALRIGIACLLIFFYCAFQLGTYCLIAACIAAFCIIAYSFMKRFTVLCHFVLGFIQFLGPVCAYLAVTNTISLPVWLLACALLCSIAASDIVYACQDAVFDRKEGLYSIPARFGVSAAVMIAQMLHITTLLILFAIGMLLDLSWVYFVGVGVIGLFLCAGYSYLMYAERQAFQKAFSFMNQSIACSILCLTVYEVVCRTVL